MIAQGAASVAAPFLLQKALPLTHFGGEKATDSKASYPLQCPPKAVSFFLVLWVLILVALHHRSGDKFPPIFRRKQIIRTRLPQGRFGSDHIGLAPLTGLEPVRGCPQQILSLRCLPIPP